MPKKVKKVMVTTPKHSSSKSPKPPATKSANLSIHGVSRSPKIPLNPKILKQNHLSDSQSFPTKTNTSSRLSSKKLTPDARSVLAQKLATHTRTEALVEESKLSATTMQDSPNHFARESQPPQAPPKKQHTSNLQKIMASHTIANWYVIFALGILMATTIFWSELGAHLQQSNADQLVNPYLFENSSTFHGAVFPGQHTFLLKWPLFFLIKFFGFTNMTFQFTTISIVMVTIVTLVFILYRVERRALIFGTLCLALASSLVLIPAQPYAGALLPVNMAMIATRNLEYILYVTSLILIARALRFRSLKFSVATILLALLIASDKLFLAFSLGGALLTLIIYLLAHQWELVRLASRWLVASAAAGIGAIIALWLINLSKLTHIANQSASSPYNLVHSGRDLVLGGIYAILGLLTNFGANPAYDTTILKNLPQNIYHRLLNIGGLAFTVNAVILVLGVLVVYRLVRTSITSKKIKNNQAPDIPIKLSLMLVWTTVVAFGVFVMTSHYYVVDARYLTIALFAVFISITTYIRGVALRPGWTVLFGLLLTVSVLLGLSRTTQSYNEGKLNLNVIHKRNIFVADAIHSHPVSILVGDYWRVIPTKLQANSKLEVMPLSDCTRPRYALSSQSWQPDLHKHSFAYLLSLDQKLTDYPRCTLAQITRVYGRPNASTLIAGTVSQPKELLLFYDRGIHNSSPKNPPLPQGPSTVVPVSLAQLPDTTCQSPTIMNVVAHQDDDLLFMNPDLLHDIQAGHCIRTVYITAGDAGGGQFYWQSRERGSEAAYSSMTPQKDDIWIQRIVKLASQQFITVATPRDNPKISLIFMHLPDGNLRGQGFRASHAESIAKLETGRISRVHTVDNQSIYSPDDLTKALSALMLTYSPTEIRTQASYRGHQFPDHSDHMVAGRFTDRAYKVFESQTVDSKAPSSIKFYVGYPTREMFPNVSGIELEAKELAFLNYAKFDDGVCQSDPQCDATLTYGAYLKRQYQNPY